MATKPAPAVTDEAMLEALAGLQAASTVLNLLHEQFDPASNHFADLADELKERCFGEAPEADEDWWRDPVVVAIDARADELAADALDELADEEEGLGEPVLRERAEQHRAHARHVRATGSIEPIRPFFSPLEKALVVTENELKPITRQLDGMVTTTDRILAGMDDASAQIEKVIGTVQETQADIEKATGSDPGGKAQGS